jgi:hypothetical protein
MQNRFIQVSGIVVEGHRVASGPSKEYPYGSLERQIPFFRSGGLDLDGYFHGTLNISIAPLRFEMLQPSFTETRRNAPCFSHGDVRRWCEAPETLDDLV